MLSTIDFSQFGPYAITFLLMAAGIAYLKNKVDKLQEKLDLHPAKIEQLQLDHAKILKEERDKFDAYSERSIEALVLAHKFLEGKQGDEAKVKAAITEMRNNTADLLAIINEIKQGNGCKFSG